MAKRTGDKIEIVKYEDPTVLVVQSAMQANRLGLAGFKVEDIDVQHGDENNPTEAHLHGYREEAFAESRLGEWVGRMLGLELAAGDVTISRLSDLQRVGFELEVSSRALDDAPRIETSDVPRPTAGSLRRALDLAEKLYGELLRCEGADAIPVLRHAERLVGDIRKQVEQ